MGSVGSAGGAIALAVVASVCGCALPPTVSAPQQWEVRRDEVGIRHAVCSLVSPVVLRDGVDAILNDHVGIEGGYSGRVVLAGVGHECSVWFRLDGHISPMQEARRRMRKSESVKLVLFYGGMLTTDYVASVEVDLEAMRRALR